MACENLCKLTAAVAAPPATLLQVGVIVVAKTEVVVVVVVVKDNQVGKYVVCMYVEVSSNRSSR